MKTLNREGRSLLATSSGWKILLQTMLFMRDGESADIVRSCIIELARLDQSRTFEFFYTAVQPDDAPVIAGIRANFGFGRTTSSVSRPFVPWGYKL